jgi:hypothetical protein
MRKLMFALMTLGLVVGLGPAALAGNMAITSFDSMPDEFVAGETYTLTYSVLQHGVTPVDGGSSLIFTDDSGNIVTFDAEPTGEPGRYQVEVTLPSAGSWEWQVTQGPFEAQQMGELTVGAGAPDATSSSPLTALKVLLPLGAVAAAWFTIREISRSRTLRSGAAAQTD